MSTDIPFILDSLHSSANVEVQVFITLFYGSVVHFCIYGAKEFICNIELENMMKIGLIDLQILIYPCLTLSFFN